MYSIRERKQNVNTFPYCIPERPKTINRINLFLINEDYACKDDENDNLVCYENKISLLLDKTYKSIPF